MNISLPCNQDSFMSFPSNQESLLEQWKHIKQHISYLNSLPGEEKLISVSQACKQLDQILGELNDLGNLDAYFPKSEIKQFFFNQFLIPSLKSILDYRSFEKRQLQEVLHNCLEQAVFLWINVLPKDNYQFGEVIRQILNPKHKYYISQDKISKVNDTTSETSSLLAPSAKVYYPFVSDNYCRSTLFFNMINNFGRKEGFLRIYDRIADMTNRTSLETLGLLCSILSNISPVLSNEFSLEFIPKLREVLSKNLLAGPSLLPGRVTQSNIRVILEALDVLLTKVMPREDFQASLADLNLQFCLNHLKSKNDKDRLRGFGILQDIVNEVMNGKAKGQTMFITETSLNRFLKENKVIALMQDYDKSKFFIQASTEFLKYIVEQGVITLDDFKFIWKSREKCYNKTQRRLYTIIRDNNISKLNLECILSDFLSLGLQKITKEDIAFVKRFEYLEIQDKGPFFEFYSQLIIHNESHFGSDVIQQCLLHLKNLNKYQMTAKTSILEKYLKILNEKPMVLSSWKIFQILWDSFDKDIEKESLLHIKHSMTFFIEKVASQETEMLLKMVNCEQDFKYFKSLFLLANYHCEHILRRSLKQPWEDDLTINVLPDQLEGYEKIWELMLFSSDLDVSKQAVEFLIFLYTKLNEPFEPDLGKIRQEYLQRCFQHTQRASLKCLWMINGLMIESERRGIGNCWSHSQLMKRELLKLQISYSWQNYSLYMYSNDPVFMLRMKLAEGFHLCWDEIRLIKCKGNSEIEISNVQNGKTLYEAGITNFTKIMLGTERIPQASFLRDKNTLNTRFVKIITNWFENNSDSKKMSAEQCLQLACLFYRGYPYYYIHPNDARIKNTFELFDDDRDGYLTLDNLLAFYLRECQTRPANVLLNFGELKVRNDFRDREDVMKEEVDITTLVRYMIFSNDEYSQLLFYLLDSKEETIASEASKIVSRLPTNPQIFSDIVLLNGVRDITELEKRDWESLIDCNISYRLLYSLQIIRYLIEKSDTSPKDIHEIYEKELWLRDPRLLANRKRWKYDFVDYGGADYLFRIFSQANKPSTVSVTLQEETITRISEILVSLDWDF